MLATHSPLVETLHATSLQGGVNTTSLQGG